MSEFSRWVWWKLFALAIVLSVFLVVYEFIAPVYSGVSINEERRTTRGLSAKLTFTKERNCRPVKGTAVAFAHYTNGYRTPVQLLNSNGGKLELRNFPPDKTPVSARLTWELTDEMPTPHGVSLSFDMTCISSIPQGVEFAGHGLKAD